MTALFAFAAALISVLLVAFAVAWWIAERNVTEYDARCRDLAKRLRVAEADVVYLRGQLHDATVGRVDPAVWLRPIRLPSTRRGEQRC